MKKCINISRVCVCLCVYKYKLIDDENAEKKKQQTETDDLQIEEENSLMNHSNMLHVRNALNINLSHLSAFDAYAFTSPHWKAHLKAKLKLK